MLYMKEQTLDNKGRAIGGAAIKEAPMMYLTAPLKNCSMYQVQSTDCTSTKCRALCVFAPSTKYHVYLVVSTNYQVPSE